MPFSGELRQESWIIVASDDTRRRSCVYWAHTSLIIPEGKCFILYLKCIVGC